MDDLSQIMSFCRVVEAGSVTEAAKLLHITKSVVSRRISALEASLGVRLLSRGPQGAVPTEAGQHYYDSCRLALNQLDLAREQVGACAQALVGRLRVTAPRSLSDKVLNPAFTTFLAAHPQVSLELNLTDRRVDIVRDGFDLGLRVGELQDSSLIGKRLGGIVRVLVASPDYLAQHGEPESLDELTSHDGIFYAHMDARHQWSFGGGDTGIKPRSLSMHGRITTTSGDLQAQAAMDGIGIATLPLFFVADALRQGKLKRLKMSDMIPRQPLTALYPSSQRMNGKLQAFIDHIAEYCSQPAVKDLLG